MTEWKGTAVKALLRCVNIAYRNIPGTELTYRRIVARRMLEVFNEELGVTIADAQAELERGDEGLYPDMLSRMAGFGEAKI